MGFIQRELDRIADALRRHPDAGKYDCLYAAQQALSWAIEPSGFAAPYDSIMGIREGSEDCPVSIHPASS